MTEISKEPFTMDITDDLYCGTLPEDLVQTFVCILCYGIVFKPIKCTKCETLVCERCIAPKKLKKFKCYKKCGSTEFTRDLKKQEKSILDNLLLRCQNDECEDKIPLKSYWGHMRKTCKIQKYEKVELPEGANGPEAEKASKPQYNFLIGDFQKIYLENGEDMDKEYDTWHQQAYDQMIREQQNEDYDEYGGYDSEYDDEY